jgi:hypothetical protein
MNAPMHLHTYRESSVRRLDLVGQNWSVDLIAVMAAALLIGGFACAIVALLVH